MGVSWTVALSAAVMALWVVVFAPAAGSLRPLGGKGRCCGHAVHVGIGGLLLPPGEGDVHWRAEWDAAEAAAD